MPRPKPTLTPGHLVISRLSGGGTEHEMRLEISDDTSGVHFIEIRMSPRDFMLALTGCMMACQMELRGLDLVGLKREHKTEAVPFDPGFEKLHADRKGLDSNERSPLTDAALKPFEVDGWMGDPSCLTNGHCRTKAKEPSYEVRFHRYVEPKTGLPVTPR